LDPTDGGRDLYRRRAAFRSQINFAEYAPFYAAANKNNARELQRATAI
jgi:hypothetical protein